MAITKKSLLGNSATKSVTAKPATGTASSPIATSKMVPAMRAISAKQVTAKLMSAKRINAKLMSAKKVSAL
ncbi:MAG: hypothetical protein WA400_05690 [Silvibacterium sp.]